MNKKRLGIFLGSIALLIVCSFAAYQYWLAPTRILIINATLAQAADIALNNDCARIEVTCIKKEEVKDLSGYDAIVMYSRGLYLDDGQIAEVERVGASGVPVFTNTLRNFTLSLNHNVTNQYIRPVGLRLCHILSGRVFQVAVGAEVNHCICLESFLHIQIRSQVAVGRRYRHSMHQFELIISQCRAGLGEE